MQESAINNLYAGINPIHFANHELDLDYFTCGLLKYIPLDINSIIFSGGLLFDAYYCHAYKTKSSYDLNKIKDIDLFLIGSNEKKKQNTIQIIETLEKVFGNSKIRIGLNCSVISIFIIGIPRIVQIVCTNYLNALDVIDNFDFAHVAMYYSSQGFYASPFAKMSIQLKQVLHNPKYGKRAKFSRLIKYKSRGMDISSYIEEFPFTTITCGIVYIKQCQQEIYTSTENLITPMLSIKNFFLNMKPFNIEPFIIDDVIWSGDFNYFGDKENFLLNNSLSVGIKKDDDQYYSSYILKNNLTSLMLNIHIKNIIKEKGGMNNYFYYMIWTISNPNLIELIKEMIKVGVNDLKIKPEERLFFETPILDSLGLSSEEKILFNVENFPHSKYSNYELTEAINQCKSLNEFCFFAPIYPEKCEFINKDCEILLKNFSDDQLDLTDFLPESGTNAIIGLTVKNIRTGGTQSVLNDTKRARTAFDIEIIF